jgi:hypothetical protein
MRLTIYLCFTLPLAVLSCKGQHQPDNTQPMYGEVEKSEAHKKADETFIATVASQFGSRDSASRRYIGIGWNCVSTDSLDMAMKRFNQAWLLNPKSPDCYWGFAVVTGRRGHDSEAIRLLKMGLILDSTHIGINNEMAILCLNNAMTAKGKQAIMLAEESTRYFSRILQCHPQDTVSYARFAVASYYAGHLRESWKAVHRYEAMTGIPIDSQFRRSLESALKDPAK